jgi:acetyl-CoA carboxylase carboxyl transferase subunit alpha
MADAAKALKLTARDLMRLGVVDEVVPEPVGGAHRNPTEMFRRVRERIEHHFGELSALPAQELIARRYAKFRRMGATFGEPPRE